MCVDTAAFAAEIQPIRRRLRQLEDQIPQLAAVREKIDLGSPRDVSRLLFELLKLPPPPSAASGKSAQLSTKAEVLQELVAQHPVVPLIMQHRSLSKHLNTLTEMLNKIRTRAVEASAAIAARRAAAAGAANASGPPAANGTAASTAAGAPLTLHRLRGHYLQTHAVTGRLAMDEPNLMCVPKPLEYSLDPSSQSQPSSSASTSPKQCLSNMRRAFVAPPGCVLLSADYRQIELRLIAHFSGDADLREMLRNPALDFFTELAARWKGVTREAVSPAQRNQAKRLAYGLLYGMGPCALAGDLECDVQTAAQLADSFRRSLPGVDAWFKALSADCAAKGYVTTLGLRRRYLPNISGAAVRVPRLAGVVAVVVCVCLLSVCVLHGREGAERQAVRALTAGSLA